jgi:ABC-type nitrate/sulfonate/bicarbonate transport system ATPase subunit
LSNIKLQVRKGEFILIVGSAGSGKSTLLDALANQIHSYFGVIEVKGTISYLEQHAPLLPGTIKFNITVSDKAD